MLVTLFNQARQWASVLEGRQEKGQGLIEYALIVLLIAIVVIVILGLVGGQVQDVFSQILTALGGTAPE